MTLAQRRAIGKDDFDTGIKVVAAEDPALEGSAQELDCDLLVAGFSQPRSIGKDMILQHGSANILVIDHVEVFGLVEFAGVGVGGFEHLGIFVIDHGLGGVDLFVEQQCHIKGLLHNFDLAGVIRVDASFAQRGEQFKLVAKAPGADSSCPSNLRAW